MAQESKVIDPDFDPKLKAAMVEIKEILKKFDVGGYVALVSQTHSEFMLEIGPTWSCAFFESNNFVRFRAKQVDYETKEQRDHAAAVTAHLILQIRDLGAQAFMFGEKLEKELSKVVEIEHRAFHGFRAHKKDDDV